MPISDNTGSGRLKYPLEASEISAAVAIVKREGGLDEFQHAVDYLLDSHYITGRILPLDGGRHIKAA